MNIEKPSFPHTTTDRPLASSVSVFLDYLDLKLRLLAVDSQEAARHVFGLLVVLGILLVLAVSSVLMYGAFLLYVIALLLHLTWGWSALICGVILTICGVLTFFILRMQLRKPVFQMTLKDLGKDRQWLSQSKTSAP